MSTFKCKMCGGALEIESGASIATCEYCGTTQTLPRIDDEKRANLYDRANHFRRNNEFDKAMGIYEQILNEDNTDAEAYWSLVLCGYGIEYVEDPATHKRVPTVNRAQFTSVFDDDNYKSALQYADSYQKSIYEQEAAAINEIQKGILAISQKEEAERIAKRNKKIAIVTTPIVCAIIAFIIVLNNSIIPNNKYNNAITLMDAGNIVEAYETLIALDGYKDSVEKADSIYDKYKVEKLKVAKTGDYVFFGAYEQDNNDLNGKEDIEWLVLEVKDGKALIISKYALDCRRYNTSYTDVTWETCTLRKWLNKNFINSAFTADEKAMIPTVTVSADKNPNYSTNPGNATRDQVFLLSITEANMYFSSDSTRVCKPTAYAIANDPYNSDSGNCWWWLRSPGSMQHYAAIVDRDGVSYEYGGFVDLVYVAVRPALWIDLNS